MLVTLNGSTALRYEYFAKDTLKINTCYVLIRIITTFINKTLLKYDPSFKKHEFVKNHTNN